MSSLKCWLWGSKHDEAFLKLKEVTIPSILAHYNPQCEVKISADASSFGLGAALWQKENSEWRPVAFASRRMTETVQRYAQIEIEALAIVWACDKFSCFVIGKRFGIETDHKPLVPLLTSKCLDTLPPPPPPPPPILRFRLDMTIVLSMWPENHCLPLIHFLELRAHILCQKVEASSQIRK